MRAVCTPAWSGAGYVIVSVKICSIPLRQIGSGRTCFRQKNKNSLHRVCRLAAGSRAVKQELAHLLVKRALAPENSPVEPIRCGRRIRVKRRAGVASIPGPENCADHLMGVGFGLNQVRAKPRALLPLKRVTARSNDPQKKCTGTDLAVEVGGESFENSVSDDQDSPKATNSILVIALVNCIAIEANRVDQFHPRQVDVDVNIQRREDSYEFAEEFAHRHGMQGDLADFAVAFAVTSSWKKKSNSMSGKCPFPTGMADVEVPVTYKGTFHQGF